jgi:hypothetical protein
VRRPDQIPLKLAKPALAPQPGPSQRDIKAVNLSTLAGGPVAASEVESRATRLGITGPALERARAELNVTTFWREGNGAWTREVCYSLTPDPTVWQPASPG